MTTYKISSHWNANTSRLHGTSYDTLQDALGAIEAVEAAEVVTDDGWSDADETGRTCEALGVYGTEADRTANDEGGAPHLCLATIRIIKENGK